jgi:anti-sigma factor RsiW
MDCNETRRLLEADLDGELDLVRHLELEAHLRTCPTCARLAENARQRRTALRESLPRFTASPQLAEKIRRALPVAPASAITTNTRAVGSAEDRATPRAVFSLWSLGGLAASFALALLVGYGWGSGRAHTRALFNEAIAEHVRSLQADHLTDVASTDQHTVKPWFAGKLDFSPPVVDLAPAGFPLKGGRLEHLDGRPAAALIYFRRQHAINLFVWPIGSGALSSHPRSEEGYNSIAWSRDGLNFLAVSEIPAAELSQFAEAFRQAAPQN